MSHPQLCTICSAVPFAQLIDGALGTEQQQLPEYAHHPSVEALESSSKSCSLCRLILKGLRENPSHGEVTELPYRFVNGEIEYFTELELRLRALSSYSADPLEVIKCVESSGDDSLNRPRSYHVKRHAFVQVSVGSFSDPSACSMIFRILTQDGMPLQHSTIRRSNFFTK